MSESVMTRSANAPDLVLRYGDDAEQIIDVRLPADGPTPTVPSAPSAAAANGPAPTVVILHGGFWRAPFDRIHTRPLADALVAAGFVAVTPEYRRTGQASGGWPGTLEDVGAGLDALPSLLAAAAPGRADLSRVVLTGHSAGGQLALWAASRKAPEALRVSGVVALAPVADLVTADRIDLDDDAVRLLLGGPHTEVPDRYAYADPVQLVPIGVPMIVMHGTADPWVPLEQSQVFVAAAAAAGDDVVLTELPGQDHYALIDPLSPAWPQVLAAMSSLG